MDKQHSLLKRQLKRFSIDRSSLSEELRDFIDAVDNAYQQSDNDRNMVERSLELSSQELLLANSELRAIFQALPDLFFRLDFEDRILDYKAGSSADSYGIERSFVGKRIQSIPLDDVRNKFIEAIQQVRKTQATVGIEYMIEFDERDNYYEARLMPLLEGQIIGIVRNISEQKKVESELKESEERFETILDAFPDPIIVYTTTGKATFVNPAFTRVFGWQPEEVVGRQIDYIPVENRQETQIVRDRVHNAESIIDFETSRSTKDGRIVDVSINASPQSDSTGKIIGSVVSVKDVTEKKKLEVEIRHAQKIDSIGTIASGVAHNFRNILSAVSVNSQLLMARHKKDQSITQVAGRIHDAIRKGAQLVDGLTRFARKSSNIEFKILNLIDVIKTTHNLISKSFDKKIEIEIEFPEFLPVLGDESDLSQVFMNLCTNARDAMPDGGRLSITAAGKGNQAEIIVSDTGSGMDPKTKEKCFDPFFTTKNPGKGTGLGLSTSYGIINEHGGEIQITSEKNKGTIFRLFFPLQSTGEDDEKEIVPEIIEGGNQKILLVDDEDHLLAPLKDLLESINYQVAAVNNGEEAITKHASWKPDAVLMDRNMPEMDGVTCAKEIINQNSRANIVFVSGYQEKGSNGIDDSTRELIKGYITKPVDVAVLSQVLAALFA
ncbi:MAG: PAS domain S-box protein [Proteobacteria bacterium]|nr:PAS domain S-box protein [Pseudomonadota bacterium]